MELDLFLMLLDWRAQGKLRLAVAKTSEDEKDTARRQEDRREPHTQLLAVGAARPELQAAHWGVPASWLTLPGSGHSRVGSPEGFLKFPQGPSHLRLGVCLGSVRTGGGDDWPALTTFPQRGPGR